MRRLLLPLVLLVAGSAQAQPLEPPPEAPEGMDYAVEPADSLADGDVELGMGAAGRAGSPPTRSRRMRFSGDELSGALREGSGDPLAGGAVEGRGALGDVTVGRLAPRWGRGLVMGAPGDPWQREPLDRGARAAFRGRAGDGMWLRRGRGDRFEALYGRFAKRPLAGARVRVGAVAFGGLTDGRGGRQSSLAFARGAGESELAWDRAGRWRAEAVLDRRLGTRVATDSVPTLEPGRRRRISPLDGWSAGLRVRVGAVGFASLAETGRAGPSLMAT